MYDLRKMRNRAARAVLSHFTISNIILTTSTTCIHLHHLHHTVFRPSSRAPAVLLSSTSCAFVYAIEDGFHPSLGEAHEREATAEA